MRKTILLFELFIVVCLQELKMLHSVWLYFMIVVYSDDMEQQKWTQKVDSKWTQKSPLLTSKI